MEAEREALCATLINLRRSFRPIAVAAFILPSIVTSLVLFGMMSQSMATTTPPAESRKTQIPGAAMSRANDGYARTYPEYGSSNKVA